MLLVVNLGLLRQSYSSCKVQAICFNPKKYRSVRGGKNRGSGNSDFQYVKCTLLFMFSCLSSIAARDVEEKASYVQKAIDEPVIEISNP